MEVAAGEVASVVVSLEVEGRQPDQKAEGGTL